MTWLRNNRPLDDRFADRVQMSESGKTHKLIIMNCRPDDSGQYTARAANSEGATSCSAPLVVETRNSLTPQLVTVSLCSSNLIHEASSNHGFP